MFSIEVSDRWKSLFNPVSMDKVMNSPRAFFVPMNSLAEDFVRYSMNRDEKAVLRIAADYGCFPAQVWVASENRYMLAFRVIDEDDAKTDLATVHSDYNDWLDSFTAEAEAALATISS